MPFPTAVNSQITDSVSQVNTKVLGDTPAVATGNFMLATSQALSNVSLSATFRQQRNCFTSQAALVQGINTRYPLNLVASAITKGSR